jgi:SPASM domain peptide maturase of grasp-with-spasm system
MEETTPTQHIKLHSNCIPVKGAMRSVICDLQRNLYIPVPHSLIDLFDEDSLLNLELLETTLDTASLQIFSEYLHLLERQEFVFHCNKLEAKNFPTINTEWDFPSQATNCVIDINQGSEHDYTDLIQNELDSVNCHYVQLRSFDAFSLSFWDDIIKIINGSPIRSVDFIIMDVSACFSHKEISEWVYSNRKIRCVTLHSSSENKIVRQQNLGFSLVLSVKEKINSPISCGNIHPSYFSINVESFTESLAHNTCLNRKIAIDTEGNIKNCPSMAKSYGNIRDTKLIDVVNNADFQKVWHIKKDEITKCKDCEFRHICTDCRAYIENPEDQYSAPLKCGYNPYTCQWEEWSTNPLKQQAIEYYGMQALVKDEK